MWLFLKDAFLSVVAVEDHADLLLVRARHKDDINAVFPCAKVKADRGRDYKFRAFIPRAQVAEAVAAQINRIDYTNYKKTQTDERRHRMVMSVWRAGKKYQVDLYGKLVRPYKPQRAAYRAEDIGEAELDRQIDELYEETQQALRE